MIAPMIRVGFYKIEFELLIYAFITSHSERFPTVEQAREIFLWE